MADEREERNGPVQALRQAEMALAKAEGEATVASATLKVRRTLHREGCLAAVAAAKEVQTLRSQRSLLLLSSLSVCPLSRLPSIHA